MKAPSSRTPRKAPGTPGSVLTRSRLGSGKKTPNKKAKRRKWTLDDDKLLVAEMSGSGENVDWAKVAGKFGRDKKLVREHWKRVLEPKVTSRESRSREGESTAASAVNHHDMVDLQEKAVAAAAQEEEDDQPSGIESLVVDAPPSLSPGLRQRFGTDQTDNGDLHRNVPTPRAIHTYTEAVSQTTTRNGLETRDTARLVEDNDKSGGIIDCVNAFFKRLFQLVLLTLLILVLYYVYIKVKKDRGVVENIQDAMKEAAAKEVAPDQPAVADV